MSHYRTTRDAAAWFRAADPETAVTEYLIQRLVVTGAVPSIRTGKKYLVAVEALEEYFARPFAPVRAPKAECRYRIS